MTTTDSASQGAGKEFDNYALLVGLHRGLFELFIKGVGVYVAIVSAAATYSVEANQVWVFYVIAVPSLLLSVVAWYSRKRSDAINTQIQHAAAAAGVGGDSNAAEALIPSKLVSTTTCVGAAFVAIVSLWLPSYLP